MRKLTLELKCNLMHFGIKMQFDAMCMKSKQGSKPITLSSYLGIIYLTDYGHPMEAKIKEIRKFGLMCYLDKICFGRT